MKKNTYIYDITDTFSDADSSKNAVILAKKIKKAQKKAFPSIEFKQHLGDKLSNIYALAQDDNIQERFSILQLFWGVATCMIIFFGVIHFYYLGEIWIPNSPTSVSEIQISENPENQIIEFPPPNMMRIQGDQSSDSSMKLDMEAFKIWEIQDDIGALCRKYGWDFIDTQKECLFPNGTMCYNYDQVDIQECLLKDASISQ